VDFCFAFVQFSRRLEIMRAAKHKGGLAGVGQGCPKQPGRGFWCAAVILISEMLKI